MIGGIYATGIYYNNYQYRNAAPSAAAQAGQVETAGKAEQTQAAGRTGSVVAVTRAANPGVPVEPVDPVPAVSNEPRKANARLVNSASIRMDPMIREYLLRRQRISRRSRRLRL